MIMKKNDKQELFALETPQLVAKLRELEAELVKARQERHLQDKKEIDIKRAYRLRKTIKLIKAEMRQRELLEKAK